MKMKKEMFLVIFLLLSIPVIVGASSLIEPNMIFKLRHYNSFLKFNKATTLDTYTIEDDRVYLDNYWFKLTKGNITFSKFFEDNKLAFSWIGSGASEVEFYSPNKPSKITFDGIAMPEGNHWFYDATSKTVRINYVL